MRPFNVLPVSVALCAIGLMGCAEFQKNWEAGVARARAKRAEALAAEARRKDPCQYTAPPTYEEGEEALKAHLSIEKGLGARNPACSVKYGPRCGKWESGPTVAHEARDGKHAKTYSLKRTSWKVCATPVSIAKYVELSGKIDIACSTKACYQNAAETEFVPGLCRYYEDLLTFEIQGDRYSAQAVTKHTVTAGNASLSHNQRFGAVVAPGARKWGNWYVQGTALSSHEMLALEAESGCEGFSERVAAREEKERHETQLAAQRKDERERAEAAAAQARYEASGKAEAEDICEAWRVEQLMQQQIDRDRRAEAISGVVNLATRHKAAQTILYMRDARETTSAQYRKKTGKSFSLGKCRN